MSDDFMDFDLPAPQMALGDGDEFDQASIDAMFGGNAPLTKKSGLKAVIESKIISHERLPMLEVVCEHMVRSFATSMRNLTSDAIDVSLEELTSIRFGEFMGQLALPAMIGVFNVPEWENYGVITVESSLIYAVVDALLGGRRGSGPVRIEGRAFTTIETTLVAKMLELALADFSTAFEPIDQIGVVLERIETNPRFAAIASPTNIAAVATFRVDMEGRGGKFSILLPYATLEPVREKLLQRFMGQTPGRGNIWEEHMATELRKTELTIDVVLGQKVLRLQEVRNFEVGQTFALNISPDDPLELQSGGITLGRAQIGQRRNNIAVRMLADMFKDIAR
ncbi:flagellar motor switch protein FliM [Sphingobium sp. BS19]|jgi:flagellar motor switch protein FliM|uniref:flagellar motor switch protein FliM n=1 Tax=Sphingobium sp. BS19 TaxID=3018973 RepID=UPI0022EDD5D1|nr:flagellar motor switch protein FliM [Sphingobium sp. BS19]GLI96287.1 flagellar motor switch protein FliM [Sphingobium sp. BS19]